VEGADVVTTITTAAEPVLTGDLVAAGMHINAAGSNSAIRCELDEAEVVRQMPLVSHRQPSGVAQPSEQTLDLPAPSIAPQFAVVCARLTKIASIRCNHLDTLLCQSPI
jgi:ornithine cyclodeaminase/alanine dehydrogenase-like protein (mu-crystallin family)